MILKWKGQQWMGTRGHVAIAGGEVVARDDWRAPAVRIDRNGRASSLHGGDPLDDEEDASYVYETAGLSARYILYRPFYTRKK